jgi:hypothetical protein
VGVKGEWKERDVEERFPGYAFPPGATPRGERVDGNAEVCLLFDRGPLSICMTDKVTLKKN